MWDKKIGLIQWTFDIIHSSHIKIFEYCKKYCDYLIVALNSNELVKKYKWKECVDTRENKAYLLESIKYIDKVIKADDESPLDMIKENNVDVFICWDEFVDKHKWVMEYMESKGWETIITPRFGMSTSKIKQVLLREAEKWK